MSEWAARAVVTFRYPILGGWITAAVLASFLLPSIFAAETGSLSSLLPSSSEALVTERRALETFGLPVVSPILAVATQDGPLTPRQVERAGDFIARVDRAPLARVGLRAVPLADVPGLAMRHGDGTIVSFLFVSPELSEGDREHAAERFAAELRRATGTQTASLTGPVPAGWAQARIGDEHLIWLELATVAIVILVLALYFRAPAIPLLGIGTVAIAYLLANRVLGWLGERFGIAIPSEVDPVIIALLFGTLTDYVVFFVSAWRRRLASGRDPREAVVAVTAELLPVVATAALMIAGSIATLLLSGVKFLSTFAPGMAIAMLIGAAVAMTVIPAVLAVCGRTLLWPRAAGNSRVEEDEPALQSRLVGVAVGRPVLTALACVVLLGAAASGVATISLGNPLIRGLPASSGPRRGYQAAAGALGPGIVGPTVLVVQDGTVSRRRRQLADLQRRIAEEPGVGAVLGPGDDPLPGRHGVVLAPGGGAARYVLVLDADPGSARATAILGDLRADMPALLERSDLPGARVAFSGETAVTAELDGRTETALLRVAPAALVVLLLLLALLLGSRTAPLYLVGASVLVVAAALGLTAWFFGALLGYGELAFFVPVAAAILLLALGSDYNVFLVSRIWRQSRRRSLPAATRVAGARAARAITVAGIVLALSFAAIVVVPILAFRELAFALAVGLLLDTLVVRTFLIPALINLFGRRDEGRRHLRPTRRATGRG